MASTMGAIKVISTCEELRRLGKRQDLDDDERHDEKIILRKAADMVPKAKIVHQETADVFRKFYKIAKAYKK